MDDEGDELLGQGLDMDCNAKLSPELLEVVGILSSLFPSCQVGICCSLRFIIYMDLILYLMCTTPLE